MSFTQLTTWIGKHAILATAIFLILTSTIGVFAAEGLAPKEFKPSSILTGNNKSSSSSSSSSSSNSSTSESSSSVSSESSGSTTGNNNSNLQTYTNPFFPDFKLVYPSDWKFETSTKPSRYENLLDREIILSKNDFKVNILLLPKGNVGGCGGGGQGVVKTQKLSNGVDKLYVETESGEKYIKYFSLWGCVNDELKTNIDLNASKQYEAEIAQLSSLTGINYDKVRYYHSWNFNRKIQDDSDPVVKELDQIISQSTFK